MAGERGLDGNLRSLRVADLAHHDLVRVMAQDGAQAAGEGESFLFIDWDLRNTLYLILDRIFDGDELVFVGFYFVESSVERGGLARAGGAGDQHHAVGFGDIATKLLDIFIAEADHIESKRAEFFAH